MKRMHKWLVALTALLAAVGLTWSVNQIAPGEPASAHTTSTYQVVWETNDPAGTDNANWAGILGNVANSLDEIGEEDMEVEVVAYGPGIHLLAKEKAPPALQAQIAELQQRGVVFAACANSMAKNGYTMDDMLDGVVQVPSGAAEVIRKQRQGWIYMHS